jgi:P27 family predicted phage terminase small subunit
LNRREAKPRPAMPSCPSHLNPVAKAEWRRITPLLHKCGLLSELDRAALAAYCQAWARWVEAERAIAEVGSLVKAPSGYLIPHPYLGIANRAMKQMHSLLAEFGMTPSSRTRIKTGAPRPPDPFGRPSAQEADRGLRQLPPKPPAGPGPVGWWRRSRVAPGRAIPTDRLHRDQPDPTQQARGQVLQRPAAPSNSTSRRGRTHSAGRGYPATPSGTTRCGSSFTRSPTTSLISCARWRCRRRSSIGSSPPCARSWSRSAPGSCATAATWCSSWPR